MTGGQLNKNLVSSLQYQVSYFLDEEKVSGGKSDLSHVRRISGQMRSDVITSNISLFDIAVICQRNYRNIDVNNSAKRDSKFERTGESKIKTALIVTLITAQQFFSFKFGEISEFSG